ncbi:hypothetical protein CEXT_136501 [Caerostris extrusa]|uniref:Uncharacterized protein n=1 Tax=Caerostris extrusa TaxID=172846 RepID=A0AAV4U2A3_CAEEX|nr:hypothetical protein CEXT_136501 [Caerostris extrusa]
MKLLVYSQTHTQQATWRTCIEFNSRLPLLKQSFRPVYQHRSLPKRVFFESESTLSTHPWDKRKMMSPWNRLSSGAPPFVYIIPGNPLAAKKNNKHGTYVYISS